VADLLWTYNVGKGHDWHDRPANEGRKSLLERDLGSLPNVRPVKEHDALDSFWGVREPLETAEGDPWNA
jgi:hypothetical protein